MTDTDPAISRAMHYVQALADRVASDPDRPVCHFLPPSRWMNDPNGTIRYGGWYHVFYQHNPFGDGWGFMHWGHARSRDLVHWEHLPIALAPAVELGEEHCFSGCIAIDRDGTPRLFYTSIPFVGQPEERFGQWRASPLDPDLIGWRRDATPAISRVRADLPDFGIDARDPFVFRHRDETFLIYGAPLGDRSTIPLFAAEGGDFSRLVYRGLLYDAPKTELPFAECPNFFPIGDRWLLLMSPYRPVEWRLGDFDGARFSVERQGLFDLHDSYYATNTLEDEQGRTVVFGWIRGFPAGKGWNGCLAFPRVVERDPRAGIRQRVHPAIESLRTGAPVHWSGVVDGRVVVDGDAGHSVEVRATLRGPATLHVAGIPLAWDGAAIALAGTSFPLHVEGALDLVVFVDRTTVEVFADEGRAVLTRVVVPEERDSAVEIAGHDAAADVVVHRLAPCRLEPWEELRTVQS